VFRGPVLDQKAMMMTLHLGTRDLQAQIMATSLEMAGYQALTDLIQAEAVVQEEPKAELKVAPTVRVVLEVRMDRRQEVLSLKAVAQRAVQILAMEALVVLGRLLAARVPMERTMVTLNPEEAILEGIVVLQASHPHREEEVVLAAQALDHQLLGHHLQPTLLHPVELSSP
jgi:hypothetical protein